MTGYGIYGVFIPDRVLAGQWRGQWKASDRLGGGKVHRLWRGGVRKCVCRWDHCGVLCGCLPFLSCICCVLTG